MRFLVLDDEQYRHDEFERRFRGHDVVHARTVAEAIGALSGERFDQVCLDHDLGDDHGTGQDVADHIAAMPRDRSPRTVVVHSFNPPGARRMLATLKETGIPAWYRPFTVGTKNKETDR